MLSVTLSSSSFESISTKPHAYFILNGISKKVNVGNVLRSCVAMGVEEVILVGSSKFTAFGAQGTERFVKTRHFSKLRDAAAALRSAGVFICGVEITPDAVSIHERPFRGPTAFLAGNEGEGLSDLQKAECDHLVYVPQYGNGTASLNVACAVTVVLSTFGAWAGALEQPRANGRDKFELIELPPKRGAETAEDKRKQEERAAHKVHAEACGGPPFGVEDDY